MRTRSSNRMTDSDTIIHFESPVGKNRKVFSRGRYSTGSTESMSDVVTPMFKKISARGGIVDSPMSSRKTTIQITPRHELVRWDVYNENGDTVDSRLYDGTVPPIAVIPDQSGINIESLVGQAMNNCLANINPSLASLGVTLAERRKTAASLRTIGRRIIKILKAIRRRDKEYLGKVISLSELEKYYMEARYAIRPLLIDAENLAKVHQRQVILKSAYRTTVRGRASDSSAGSKKHITEWNGGGPFRPQLFYTTEAHSTTDVQVRAWATVEYSFDNILENEFVHLGLADWASTAWELIPFSFIVDWFFTTADFVGTFNPTFSAKIISSGYTITTTSVSTQAIVDSGVTTPKPEGYDVRSWIHKSTGGSIATVVVTKERVITPLERHWPNLDIRLDSFKLLDLSIIAKNLLPMRR